MSLQNRGVIFFRVETARRSEQPCRTAEESSVSVCVCVANQSLVWPISMHLWTMDKKEARPVQRKHLLSSSAGRN